MEGWDMPDFWRIVDYIREDDDEDETVFFPDPKELDAEDYPRPGPVVPDCRHPKCFCMYFFVTNYPKSATEMN